MKKKYIFIISTIILLFAVLLFIRLRKIEEVVEVVPPAEGICQLKSLEKIAEGAFPRWSPDGSLITFTKEVVNPTDPHGIGYEIYTMKPDGSEVQCLTCNRAGLANTRWRGQSYWHPNGKYITFTAENAFYPRRGNGTAERPGLGRNHNVWIMTADGQNFWQMTDYPENWGTIEARFSHDGTKLYWNEEFMMEKYPQGKPEDPVPHPGCYWGGENFKFRKGEELCAWRVKYSDISFGPEGPIITNIRTINPPDNFTLLEGTGFTPDDQGFIYSYANLIETKGSGLYGEIYISDLNGNSLTQLTHTPFKHDEDAEYSPDRKKIVYKEALRGLPGEDVEIFLMDSDGSNKMQLTEFNNPQRPEYLPGALQITEISWSPDGRQIIYGHASREEGSDRKPAIKPGGAHLPSDLYIITFKGPCGKQ